MLSCCGSGTQKEAIKKINTIKEGAGKVGRSSQTWRRLSLIIIPHSDCHLGYKSGLSLAQVFFEPVGFTSQYLSTAASYSRIYHLGTSNGPVRDLSS